MNKAMAVHCPWCGAHWQQVAERQYTGQASGDGWNWQPSKARRRPSRSPARQKPQQPGGKAKGKQKTAPVGEPHTWTPLPPPWKSADGKGSGSGTAEDPRLQELLGAIRSSFSSQQMPAAVAEAMARVEEDSGRMLTRTLHTQTTHLGAAKKQLQEARAGRKAQEAAWVEFLNSTVQSLEKGHKEFLDLMAKFDARETEAQAKMGAARKAIRDLAANERAAKEEIEESEDSDVELMELSGASNAVPSEDTPIGQAQKRLRLTMDALMTRMPLAEDGTPRRRTKPERGENAAPEGGVATAPEAPPA